MSTDIAASWPRIPLTHLDPMVVNDYISRANTWGEHSLAGPASWIQFSKDLYDELANKKLLQDEPTLPPSTQVTEELLRFLDGIQANILTPHGRNHGRLLFFRFLITDPVAIRSYLKQINSDILTSALVQYQQARHNPEYPKLPIVSLALTHDGVCAAGCALPYEQDVAFKVGMYRRRHRIGDKTDWPEEKLREGHPYGPIHGAWLVANSNLDALNKTIAEIEARADNRMVVVHRQEGVILRNRDDKAVEPFGFRDGVSMPEFFVPRRLRQGIVNMPLDQVLLSHREKEAGSSFLVYRKLKQDVAEFRALEQKLADLARAKGLDPLDAGRFLIGRTRDGRPMQPTRPQLTVEPINNFDYRSDPQASRCPFHAHIRKANPRSLIDDVEPEQDTVSAVQMVRRGLIYGTEGKLRFDPRDPIPADTGLLFMGYMADISKFELMHSRWFGQSEAPESNIDNAPDPILYGGPDARTTWEWPGLGDVSLDLKRLVTPQSGAYLFVPSRRWLLDPPLASAAEVLAESKA